MRAPVCVCVCVCVCVQAGGESVAPPCQVVDDGATFSIFLRHAGKSVTLDGLSRATSRLELQARVVAATGVPPASQHLHRHGEAVVPLQPNCTVHVDVRGLGGTVTGYLAYAEKLGVKLTSVPLASLVSHNPLLPASGDPNRRSVFLLDLPWLLRTLFTSKNRLPASELPLNSVLFLHRLSATTQLSEAHPCIDKTNGDALRIAETILEPVSHFLIDMCRALLKVRPVRMDSGGGEEGGERARWVPAGASACSRRRVRRWRARVCVCCVCSSWSALVVQAGFARVVLLQDGAKDPEKATTEARQKCVAFARVVRPAWRVRSRRWCAVLALRLDPTRGLPPFGTIAVAVAVQDREQAARRSHGAP